MVKALLQGRPLGAPLHAVLVHMPIGLFILAIIFDVWSSYFDGGNEAVRAAFAAILFGVVTAGVAAVPGLVDWSDIRKDHPARRTATIHMILNLTAVTLFVVSLGFRIGTRDEAEIPVAPFVLSLVGLGMIGVSGYLGGVLVYRDGIGVGRHRRSTETPQRTISITAPEAGRYAPVEDDARLGEGETLRVDLDGTIVTIARSGATLYAFQEFCTHRFGPLSEGHISDGEIECPWHRSRFNLRSGNVAHGPAKVNLKTFDVIALNGVIYLRDPEDARPAPAQAATATPEPALPDDVWQSIKAGDELISAQGRPAGRVVEVLPDHLAVRQGENRPTVSYVPRQAIVGRVDGRIRVDIAADQVHYRWG